MQRRSGSIPTLVLSADTEQGPSVESESVKTAGASQNVFIANPDRLWKELDIEPLLKQCDPDVERFCHKIRQMKDAAEGTRGVGASR
jgi:hypothetical protein